MPVVPIDQLALALYITVVSAVLTGMVLRATSGLRAEMKAEISGLRSEMRDGDQSLAVRMETGFARVDQQLTEIRQEMSIMRSDLTRVALEVGVEPREASGT